MTTISVNGVVRSLEQGPGIVEGLIAAVPDQALTWREAENTWNAVEILCHLADGEITDWMPRIQVIVSGGRRFPPYDRVGGFARYEGWSAIQLVGEFAQLRRMNVKKLAELRLSPAQLTLTGEHPDLGIVTLAQLLACWATHDLAHIAQLARLFTRWLGPEVGPWARNFSLLQGAAH